MAYGLEIKDSAGNVVVSITDRLTKLLGSVSISATGSQSLPSTLTGNDYWFAFIPSTGGFSGTPPSISVSSGVLYWTYPSGGSNLNGTIHYGLY